MNKVIIKVKDVEIGNGQIVIQSMTSFAPSNIKKTIKTINELETLGCQIIRVSILNEEDALALSSIIPHINIPLVADIHYSSDLALRAIENGANAIRINPGNIDIKDLEAIINKAKEYNIPIRIGVNSGSINAKYDALDRVRGMLESMKEYVKFFEEHKFSNLVLSAKSTDIDETIKINKLLHKEFKYPLHIGLTEAGDLNSALIRSTLALSPLLKEGIGDTIRISINDEPKHEVIAAKELLIDLGLIKGPTLIACPTCGRCMINSFKIVKEIKEYLSTTNKDIKVAVMGCVVNGLGEGKHADIGIAGGKHYSTLFTKGKPIKQIKNKDIVKELINEIKKIA